MHINAHFLFFFFFFLKFKLVERCPRSQCQKFLHTIIPNSRVICLNFFWKFWLHIFSYSKHPVLRRWFPTLFFCSLLVLSHKISENRCCSLFGVCFPGLYLCELSQHRLLLAEGREGDAADNPDRHLQLQQLQQQAHSQGLRSDQGLLWQGEDGRLVWSRMSR